MDAVQEHHHAYSNLWCEVDSNNNVEIRFGISVKSPVLVL